MAARRAAYHQGVAWVYLLGAFARAAMGVDPNDFELQMDIHDVVEQATQGAPLVGNVAQVASGDAPHQPGGCPAQAWSVAELLRAAVDDVLEIAPRTLHHTARQDALTAFLGG